MGILVFIQWTFIQIPEEPLRTVFASEEALLRDYLLVCGAI